MFVLTRINLCRLKGLPILEQLKAEEALLRVGSGNWCLINEGAPAAIVMGISGKTEELIDPTQYQKSPVPVIRRFSGGGTVFIEENTLFVTFLFERADLDLGTSPKNLLEWTENLYKPLFAHTDFEARENDYVIGDKKIGGNAQYISKAKWLHHTSFLWDFCPDKMQLLKMPPKVPQYRNQRSHDAFLTKLKYHFHSKEHFFDALIAELATHFELNFASLPLLETPHRQSVELLDKN
ncbi:MAG: lipoate--protein ligase family protein [Verrucomicrobia bacterium]|nr:lipoate--protein ligase family protein [Verrucomicrobiota bacterium]